MSVLILLIIVDLIVIGIVMYFVMNERPKHQTEPHPFVVEAHKMEEKAAELEAAAKTEEKAE